MLTTMVYDIGDRIRSFELITEKVAGSLVKPGGWARPACRTPAGPRSPGTCGKYRPSFVFTRR